MPIVPVSLIMNSPVELQITPGRPLSRMPFNVAQIRKRATDDGGRDTIDESKDEALALVPSDVRPRLIVPEARRVFRSYNVSSSLWGTVGLRRASIISGYETSGSIVDNIRSSIMRRLAGAVDYLHADRNLVHQTLIRAMKTRRSAAAQLVGGGSTSPRTLRSNTAMTDMYAFGMLLYEMFAGPGLEHYMNAQWNTLGRDSDGAGIESMMGVFARPRAGEPRSVEGYVVGHPAAFVEKNSCCGCQCVLM